MISDSGNKLRELINNAIDDGIISPEEYDAIIHMANEDGHIDAQERAMLKELQEMIETKMIKFQKK